MKRTICVMTLVLLPMVSVAQAAKLKMPDFSSLASRATESVDISLDGDMLKSASSFLGGGKEGGPALQETLQGLQGIYVKVFSFDKPDVYSRHDVDGILEQASGRGWKSLMSIRDKGERVEMRMRDPGPDGGFLLVVTAPTELVIINIAGDVNLEKLRQLQGKLGVPHIPGIAGPP